MSWVAVAAGIGAAGMVGSAAISSGGAESSAEQPRYVRQSGKNLRDMSGAAVENYDPTFFSGQQYAEQSPYSQQAIQGMGQFNSQPSQDYLSSVMGGDYLGMNPQMQNAVMNPAMQGVNDQFNSAGRYGSAMNQQQSAQAGMSALMPYYDAERQRQQQAASLLPQLQANDLEMQARGGAGAEGYAQRPIDQAMAQHQFQNQQPLMQAEAYRDLVSPMFGVPNQQQASSSPGFAKNLSGLLSGAGSYFSGAGNYLQNSTAGADIVDQGTQYAGWGNP
jgi:hypothetical protein